MLADSSSDFVSDDTGAYDRHPLAADPGAPDGGDPMFYLNPDQRAGIADNGKVSYTIDRAALQMTGYTEQTNADGSITLVAKRGWSFAAGIPYTVSYGFRSDQPDRMPDDTAGFQRFNATQITQAELALKGWSDVANITFTRVGVGNSGEEAYTNQATILFSNYSSGVAGASAFSFFPANPNFNATSGDVWINSTLSYNVTPTMGNYGGQVLVHEIGHAIGFDHPSDYNANADQTFTYAADASYYEDSRQYTVMSYFNEFNTGGNFGPLYSAAPLVDDIAAAQVEYGANMHTRTGDTVYGFNSNADAPWFITNSAFTKLVFAVWDAGGNDTFDFSGYANAQIIDLREGFFSNVGGLLGNVAVAQGAKIENAISGTGADNITGNALANVIQSGAGADTVNAGAGADTIDGGAGQSYLRGDDGNDAITGGSLFDDINGNTGDDTVHGNGGDDYAVGGKDNDVLFGDAGVDIVWGNLGNDTIDGGEGDDQVRGGQGDDIVSGGAGNDFVSGDRGADTITGGAGADNFHGSQDAGIDRVLDFSVAEGDRVQLDPGTTYALGQAGEGVVLDMGGGNQMILVGVSLNSLTATSIFLG